MVPFLGKSSTSLWTTMSSSCGDILEYVESVNPISRHLRHSVVLETSKISAHCSSDNLISRKYSSCKKQTNKQTNKKPTNNNNNKTKNQQQTTTNNNKKTPKIT